MAHFAHLNSENKVIRISVVSNDIETSDGPLGENEMHVDGETWCQNFHSGKPWTVDNGNNVLTVVLLEKIILK